MNYINTFNEWNTASNVIAPLTKSEFLHATFPYINEDTLHEEQKNILFALYEADSLFQAKQHWFSVELHESNRPMILNSETHSIICFNKEFFAITNESFDVLFSEYLNENIFSDAWDSVSNFFSNAWGGIKSVGEKIGDWTKELSDGAKATAGFVKLSYMATTALRSNDWKEIANTIFNITQVLASTYAKQFNLSESNLAQVSATCAGIINLWDGRNLFLEAWKPVGSAKPTNSEELVKFLKNSTPNAFIGVTKMLVGVKDLGKAANKGLKYEGLTNLELFIEEEFTKKIQSASEGLLKEGDGMGLSNSIFELSNEASLGTDANEKLWKSFVLCQITHGLENVYSTIKPETLDALKKANEYIPKAKEFPNLVQNWINTAEKTKLEGGLGMIQDAIKTMGQPMIEASKNFTQTILPELMKTAEWMGQLSPLYDKGNQIVSKNCNPSKVALAIPILPAIKESGEDVKLAKNDIDILNKNLKSIAQSSGIKESRILPFEKWITRI